MPQGPFSLDDISLSPNNLYDIGQVARGSHWGPSEGAAGRRPTTAGYHHRRTHVNRPDATLLAELFTTLALVFGPMLVAALAVATHAA